MEYSPPIRRADATLENVGEIEPKPTATFYRLDPNVRITWMLGRIISFFFIMFPVTFLLILAVGLSGWIRFGLFTACGLMVMIAGGQIFWPFVAYPHWGYALRDHDLLIRRGVIVKRIYAVPFSRIQHVDTHSGWMERSFGLANLVVHTAGAMLGSLTVPGLPKEDAEALRDYLSEVGHTHANI
ncbi:PH domain-containing protein [Acanthopleuribacter pedis]|uniref:PH domain-containing protein n=1 Tax=Acanthopleuribacter pedis TaxID=442870 RepID=A0A8J7QHQ3_9BACT|nr:PH domain-containing protein [Acanthopleuribacter pedis]MBO1320450.1 PH domain-containing protein [Acanthopleuribacter pedis]